LVQSILLFDLDGVLIYPGGYKAAFRATLENLLSKMHVSFYMPSIDIYETFESVGIGSEWDMLPITFVIILDHILPHVPEIKDLTSFEDCLGVVSKHSLSENVIDYHQTLKAITPLFSASDTPLNGMLEHLSETELLPNIQSTALLKGVITESRSINNSLILRTFQNYVLGDKAFEKIYHQPADFSTPSFIEVFDRSLISNTSLNKIKSLVKNPNTYPVVSTLRTSAPPKEICFPQDRFPSESDLALDLLDGFSPPVIGYGKMANLANEYGVPVESLIKPSPIQTLGAIATAYSGKEWDALRWAHHIHNMHERNTTLKEINDRFNIHLPKQADIHIFEDANIGIISCNEAASLLSALGYQYNYYLWGIALEQQKITALQNVGAKVFSSFDEAIDHVFSLLNKNHDNNL